MVKVIGWKEPPAGRKHNRLILQGDVEFISSQKRKGQYYATVQECSIACTFTKAMCENLIGKTIPGSIEKMECEPYKFQAPNSDEILLLDYTYYYSPSEKTLEQAVFMTKPASILKSKAA